MSSNPSPDPGEVASPRNGSDGVCLVIPTLARPGGAERVAVLLAGAWNAAGRRVVILTTDSSASPPFFEVPPDVEVRNLSIARDSRHLLDSIVRNFRQLVVMRRAVRDAAPSVVISFIDVLNVAVVFACLGTGIPVIAADRTSPAHAPIGRLWTFLRNAAYRMADRVVVQSAGAYAQLVRSVGQRLAIIPNPVPAVDASQQEESASRVVAIGRFTQEKGFDLLIRSFATVAGRYPHWTVTIFGDGPLRPQLESLIVAEGMSDRVFLPGVTENSSRELAAADIFVLSSHYEGFPNALCEAMAAGVACIATDCPEGPRDIVRDGIDGILVPPGRPDDLGGALMQLMGSAAERRRLGTNAREGMGRFSVDRVVSQWNELIVSARLRRGQAPKWRASTARGARR